MNISFDYEEIKKQICQNDNLNFLAYAMTPLHAVGVNASVIYFNECKIELNGYIIITSHKKTGKHLSPENFRTNDNKILVVEGCPIYAKPYGIVEKLRTKFCAIHNIKEGKRKIYVVTVNPEQEIYNLIQSCGAECVFLIIDNGGASYISRMKNALSMATAYSAYDVGLKKSLYMLKVGIGSVILDYCVKRYYKTNHAIDFRIFKNNEFLENELVIPFYKKSFQNAGSKKYIFDYNSAYVLINTQCFFECNMTDGVVDYNVYKQAVNVIKKYCKNIVVKPHPRELDVKKYNDLGCDLYLDNNVSQEAILANSINLPIAIISITSSTLLNAKALFDIPAISLANLFLEENLSIETRNETRDYLNQYAQKVEFPKDILEFDNIIKSYADREYKSF